MSGQVSSAESEQALLLGLDVSETQSLQLGIEDRAVSDPVADFLEKHGQEFTYDHEGNLVTYYDAVNNCPPFRALVQAIGEGVLGMTATIRTAEIAEDEQEESEIKEAVEEGDEKNEETKGAEKRQSSTDRDELITSQKDIPEKSPQSGKDSQGQEAPQLSNRSTNAEVTSYSRNTNSGSSQTSTSTTAQAEKRAQTAPAQEAKTVATPTLGDSYEAGKTATLGPEPVSSGQADIKPPETQTLPLTEARSNIHHQVSLEKKISSDTVLLVPPPETESMSELPDLQVEAAKPESEDEPIDFLSDSETSDENSLIEDEEYSIPTLEAEITYTDIDFLQDEALTGDGEFIEKMPEDVSWQATEDLVIGDVQEIGGSEYLTLPIEETQFFDASEYLAPTTEAVPELSVPVEELEQAILELAERIEEREDEKTEVAYQILDEIVQKMGEVHSLVEVDSQKPEEVLMVDEKQEELKQLFIQLFDYMEIEFTPELIDSFVNLALKGDVSELIAVLEQDEEIATPQDSGTHEIIKQLLVAVNNIKKAVLQAYHLGKSALRLYSQCLTLAPA